MKKNKKPITALAAKITASGTKGVFKAKAKKQGMTTKAFMRRVLSHPKDYALKTVRQAAAAKALMRASGAL